MKMAVKMLIAYIRALCIDFFAVPVEDSKGLHIAIIAPDMVIRNVENNTRIIERDKGELFARLKRVYTATIVCPLLRPVMLLDTPYKRLKDIPPYHCMKSRGFELVVCDALNAAGYTATHKGNELASIDIVCAELGNIEVKIGRGKFKKEK